MVKNERKFFDPGDDSGDISHRVCTYPIYLRIYFEKKKSLNKIPFFLNFKQPESAMCNRYLQQNSYYGFIIDGF